MEMSRSWKTAGMLMVALGAVLASHLGCSPAEAQLQSPSVVASNEDGERRTISVSGSGTASAQPDEVVVRLGVETTAETAREAVAQNSEQMTAVIDALREAGIPAENIQTQTIQLRARYETVRPEPGAREERELVGYEARNIVEARTDDLEAVGELLDAAVQAGANRIEGLRFELSDPTELLERARAAAWEDAEQKAEQLGALAGVELAAVLTITEATTAPRPAPGVGALLEREAAVPIEPGTEDVRVDLQVTWSLE